MTQLYGWQNKILWIDLADKTSKVIDISNDVVEYMGGRGLAIKLAFDYMKPGTKAYDPENLLMFMTGPVTGTPVFGSGRGYIFGVGAGTYPEHFSRTGMGGRWATGLKYAGYDGVILANKSDSPVLLEINEKGVVFHDASARYWGTDINTMEQLVREDFGDDADCCMIGPAGEKLVRWAAVMSNTGHAAGQGGMGAVMGDKKVKALVFTGHSGVEMSDFNEINKLRTSAQKTWNLEKGKVSPVPLNFAFKSGEDALADGDVSYASTLNVACRGCGARCHNVNTYFRGLKGRVVKNPLTNTFKCVDGATVGWPAFADIERDLYIEKLGRPYRWPFDMRGGFEAIAHTNNLGLNSWEFESIYLWLTELEMEGIDVGEFIGMDYDVDDPSLLPKLAWMCGYREGCGEMFADGIARLAEKLGGVYEKYAPHALNGYCTHSLGTDCWKQFRYPYWVPVALEYAVDQRDPISDSGHRYALLVGTQLGNGRFYEDAADEFYGIKNSIGPYHERRKCSFYPNGDLEEDVFDDLAYADKEVTAHVNLIRGVIIGCGVLCDRYYPIPADANNEEGLFVGDNDIEARIMSAVTGVDYTMPVMTRNAEKIYLMERCYAVLENGRNKEFDMGICHIQPRGDWTTGKRIDKDRFEKLLERYYAYVGWDENGIPTSDTLKKYDLSYLDELLEPFRGR